MSVDLEPGLRELAGRPSRDFDVHAAMRRARRRRAASATGAATSVAAVAAVATLVLGGTGPSVPVIVDGGDPDVAASAERSTSSEIVGDGEFVVVLTPVTENVLADLEAQAHEQALDAIIAGEPTPRWQDLTVDLRAVDPDLHPVVEQYHAQLTAPSRRGQRPIILDGQRSLLQATQRRVLQELPPPTAPPFDLALLHGPPDAEDRELAWYMADDGSGGLDDARIEGHLGPVLDDLCGWLGDRHADADARFRDLTASTGRFETAYGLPPLPLHEPLAALGEPPIGDGLAGWIDERCSSAFPDFEPWPEHETVEDDSPPPEPNASDQATRGPSEEAVAAALAHKPTILGEPREAGTGHIFGYSGGREQPTNQEGIAVFLMTDRPVNGSDDTETLWLASAPWAEFDRLETESDGWPPGTVAIINGHPGDATQVIFHVDGTIVNLSADDPGANGVIEGWALDIAWDVHSGGAADQ
jgi:hypothetical protein